MATSTSAHLIPLPATAARPALAPALTVLDAATAECPAVVLALITAAVADFAELGDDSLTPALDLLEVIHDDRVQAGAAIISGPVEFNPDVNPPADLDNPAARKQFLCEGIYFMHVGIWVVATALCAVSDLELLVGEAPRLTAHELADGFDCSLKRLVGRGLLGGDVDISPTVCLKFDSKHFIVAMARTAGLLWRVACTNCG